jgi:hypothetical protein
VIQGTRPHADFTLMAVNLVFGDVSALLQGSFPSLYEEFLTFVFCCSDTWYLVIDHLRHRDMISPSP